MLHSRVVHTLEPEETAVDKSLKKGSGTERPPAKPQKDISLRINRMAGTGRYEVITVGPGKQHAGRTVVLTSPRSLAFPKKG